MSKADAEPTIDESKPTAEFFHFLRDARNVYVEIGWGLVAPLLTYLLNVASPYPDQAAVSIAASIAAFVAIMFAFQLWFRGRANKKHRDTLLIRFGISGLVALVFYVGLYSMFVVADPSQDSREVVGYSLRPNIKNVRDGQMPPMNDRELLENFGGEPERIWTKLSLTVTRMSLLSSWILFWFLLTSAIGVFLCDSWLKRQRKGA